MTTQMIVRVNPDLKNKVNTLAKAEGKSVSEVVRELLEDYVKNRDMLKKSIKQKYPDFVEKILFKSMLKMKKASQEKIIDYMILKCEL